MERVENYGSMIEQVYLGAPNKSAFDRSHHNYLTGKLGTIIPTRIDEVYPGDRIKGHIQGVVNFEPLAAPILGNMRYKQESFYVPDSIVWKNAHKFYTGKKGFNIPRPSVSPRGLFNAYIDLELLPGFSLNNVLLDSFFANLYDFNSDRYESYSHYFLNVVMPIKYVYDKIKSFATMYQALDLFQPLLDLIDEYFIGDSSSVEHEGNTYYIFKSKIATQYYSDKDKTWPVYRAEPEAKLLCEFLFKYYNFLFGPSSFIDYIGFPCYTHFDDLFLNSLYNRWTGPIFGEAFLSPSPYENLIDLYSQISLNWLPFRAAYVVWYWNYRDELLETDALDPESDDFLGDTPSNTEIVLCSLIRYRCWYKDTFTTALTHTGDGNLSVPIILSDNYVETYLTYYNSLGNTIDNVTNHDEALQAGAAVCQISIGNLSYRVPMNYFGQQNRIGGGATSDETVPTLSLDLFDRIKRLQKFVQKKLVLGYEYDDVVWSSFLVKLSNVRMRIPEILGRGSDLVEMNTVVNNTNTAEQIAGDKTAVAWAQGSQRDINYFAEEHGYFLSFMTILPIQSYSGGMQRLWLKREQFDVFWPEFATMGMDAVYNIELAAPTGIGVVTSDAPAGLTDEQAMSVFGYQGRYYDLKARQDEEHGRLRTDLNYLTFARDFDSKNLPKLNYIFVHCHPSLDMFVTDDPTEDVFRADIYHALDFERRLPVADIYV